MNRPQRTTQVQAAHALAVAQQYQTLMEQQAAARQRSGKDTTSLCINPTEPEAALQKQKWAGICTGLYPFGLSEYSIDHCSPYVGYNKQPTLLLDSGYFQDEVFQISH